VRRLIVVLAANSANLRESLLEELMECGLRFLFGRLDRGKRTLVKTPSRANREHVVQTFVLQEPSPRGARLDWAKMAPAPGREVS